MEKLKTDVVAKKISALGLSQREFANRVKISPSTLNSWLTGERNIKYSNALALASALRCSVEEISNYKILSNEEKENRTSLILSLDEDEWDVIGQIKAEGLNIAEKLDNAERGVKFIEKEENKLFPVIGQAAAAGVNTLAYPLAEYANENAEAMQYFPSGRSGDFAIEVAGDSMLPWYPSGTLLLVRPYQRLRTGMRVIAILDTGEVFFKVYGEKKGKVMLMSLDETGKDFVFEPDDFGCIKGIYQVIASVRDEERLDREMNKAGIHHRWEQKMAKL